MSWAAVIIGGATLVGGLVASNQQENAAEDAAAAQQQSADQSIAEARRQYDQTRADNEPFREAGLRGLRDLQNYASSSNDRPFTMADFQADPGYQFRLAEGEKALNRSIAAKSGVLSGGAVREGERYASGLASQEYGAAFDRFEAQKTNRFNRLASLAGTAQTANADNQNAGQQMSSNVINSLSDIGNARSQLSIASGNARANAITGAINTGTDLYALSQYGRG